MIIIIIKNIITTMNKSMTISIIKYNINKIVKMVIILIINIYICSQKVFDINLAT